MQVAQGDLAQVLRSYQAGLAIRERLAGSDPRNTMWQRDLSISYDRIGKVQQARDELSEALRSYQASVAIAERLAAEDHATRSGNAIFPSATSE